MNPFQLYIKLLLEKNLFDSTQPNRSCADVYNEIIFPAVQQGAIQDVTPKDIVLEKNQVVGAVVKFPNGDCWRINIYNPVNLMNPEKRYNYKCDCNKVLQL